MTILQTYLLFRLDTIVGLLNFFLAAFIIVTIIGGIITGICIVESHGEEEKKSSIWIKAKSFFKKVIPATLIVTLLYMAIPSTKEAAAMLILPKITDEKVVNAVTDETKEIYALFKQFLQDKIGKKEVIGKIEVKK